MIVPAADLERYGPPDLREIRGEDIGAARQRLCDLLQGVWIEEGRRAALINALAAVPSAVDALIELGGEGLALSVLRLQLATVAERVALSGTNENPRTLQ